MGNLIRKALILKATKNANAGEKGCFPALKAEKLGNKTVFSCSGKFLSLDTTQNDVINGENILYLIVISDYEKRYLIENIDPKKDFYKPFYDDFALENGFAAAIFKKYGNNTFTPVFFGKTQGFNLSETEIYKIYEENYKENLQSDNDKKEEFLLHEKADGRNSFNPAEGTISDEQYFATERDSSASFAVGQSQTERLNNADYQENIIYNDEAVATENYYGDNYESVSFKNDGTFKQTQSQNAETGTEFNSFENEATLYTCPFEKPLPKFYSEIKEKIDDLFSKYEPIGRLSELIPESKWVKIEYKKSAFYILGIICEKDIPKYIVYGVPGNRTFKPRGFETYSVFLPESLFDREGKGYWCMFQNAETGNSENPDE